MSDLGIAVDSDVSLTAFIPPASSSSSAPSDVSNDAWHRTFNAAQLANAGVAQWLPPGGTYETDTWSATRGAPSNTLPNAPTSPATPSTAPAASFAERFAAATPATTAGGTSAAGATAQASHSPAAGSAGATPSPIDPRSLPLGPLDKANYDAVAERNKYLASKYDPNSLYDRFINSFTGAMNDPANLRTPAEQAEYEALRQKLIDTVYPPSTLAEARLDMMAASPIGTSLSVGARAIGGGQQAQDLALIGGSVVDSFGLGRRMQPEGQPSVTAALRRQSAEGLRRGTVRYHQLVNKLNRIRNEAAGGGNKGISGIVNGAEADFLGERWAGDGYRETTTAKGTRILISSDGLRQYRAPSPKSSDFATTGVQANFQARSTPDGDWTSNVHVNVAP